MINQTARYLLLTITLALFIAGCNQNGVTPASQPSGDTQRLSSDPVQVSTVEATASKPLRQKISPLDYAQKEYLTAYNDYVRLLRESGPQTIETLQALALYQRKYQIYQMLIKAEGGKSE